MATEAAKRTPRGRLRRKAAAGFAAIALAAVGGWATMSGVHASAESVESAGDQCTSANPPAGCHFVQVSNRVAPKYSAEAWLYDKNGKEVYHWLEDRLGGGKGPTWWYIAADGGSLKVTVIGVTGLPGGSKVETTGLTLDRDYCFHVNAVGHVKYTGDSKTGGCTKD